MMPDHEANINTLEKSFYLLSNNGMLSVLIRMASMRPF